MPRVYLTDSQRQIADEQRRRERVRRIILSAMVSCGVNREQLCMAAKIGYQTFNHRMRGESDFRLGELTKIADCLCLDIITRAALVGSLDKCRFEKGYTE